MNVSYEGGDVRDPFWLDFEKGVKDWEVFQHEETDKSADDEEEENNSVDDSDEDAFIALNSQKVEEAKGKELKSWEDNSVYKVVRDEGQTRINTRWICNERNNGIKARLVAKGFQDPE